MPGYVTHSDGTTWKLGEHTYTCDGFVLATGVLVDSDTGEEQRDEAGFPIVHEFFLGSKADLARARR